MKARLRKPLEDGPNYWRNSLSIGFYKEKFRLSGPSYSRGGISTRDIHTFDSAKTIGELLERWEISQEPSPQTIQAITEAVDGQVGIDIISDKYRDSLVESIVSILKGETE